MRIHRPDIRREMWLGLGVAALAVAGCSGGNADGSAPESASPPSDSIAARSSASDALLERLLTEDEPGCSAAVGVEGEVAWAGTRGLADVDTGAALVENNTFHVGSVTKQFTATAVLLLALDGRLGLDDSVARWVPGLPGWSQEVTVEQLVHHTSGIPDLIDPLMAAGFDTDDRVTQQDAITVIAGQEPTYPPGERAEYSNSGYVLLAEVVRAASGQPLPEYLQERVFDPLGLDMAIDPAPTSPEEADPTTVRGHERDDTGQQWQPSGARWELVGPGFLQTTPSELVRWADNYRTGQVGGRQLLDAQVADAVSAGSAHYGAGIFLTRDGGLWHAGEWAGQIADFSVSPDRRVSVAVACNSYAGSSAIMGYIANGLRAEWFE